MKESVYANVELEKEVSWFLKAFIFHRMLIYSCSIVRIFLIYTFWGPGGSMS
jgi:hypothetical protein